jgi:hypothetical protein
MPFYDANGASYVIAAGLAGSLKILPFAKVSSDEFRSKAGGHSASASRMFRVSPRTMRHRTHNDESPADGAFG